MAAIAIASVSARTSMASQSIKVTARNQMGHKDINVTLGIYTSLDKKFKKKKINLLYGYLSQETG